MDLRLFSNVRFAVVAQLLLLSAVVTFTLFACSGYPAYAAGDPIGVPMSWPETILVGFQLLAALLPPDLIQTAFMGLYAVIAWGIHSTVKNKALKEIFMASLDKAAGYGVRAVKGWVEKNEIPELGNQRLLKALIYAQEQFPKLAKQMGYDKAALARMLWARLPEVPEEAPDFAALVVEWERKGLIK